MPRNLIIALSAIALVYSIYIKSYSKSEITEPTETKIIDDKPFTSNNSDKSLSDEKDKTNLPDIDDYPQPENGFSPYKDYFGNGIYENNSGNEFIIKNSNSTDAVVLLVNAYSGKKIRNEFIKKSSTFSMTGVPNGTYYLQWSSGNNWNPSKKVGNLRGGFQNDISFSKTENSSDWMEVKGYQQWTVTLYSVFDGDVETDNISALEFSN